MPGAALSSEFHGRGASFALADLADGSFLCGDLEALRSRSVLIVSDAQLPAAIALAELDGIARRVVLCTPDLTGAQLAAVAAAVDATGIVTDRPPDSLPDSLRDSLAVRCAMGERLIRGRVDRRASERTEWILLTSGTTGAPKLVVHTLQSLAGALPRRAPAVEHAAAGERASAVELASARELASAGGRTVWSTFYDIRRYGGLQIYLRAVLGGASLLLSSPAEPMAEFLARAAAAGVTHLSGTPSHRRRMLMSGASGLFSPRYIRLSGEVADQPLLDRLRATYPEARIAHAFASTEAGVAFEVDDGLAGFPAAFLEARRPSGVDLKVAEGTLWIRSRGAAARYLGAGSSPLDRADGFVDTGDLVELVGNRYHFRGRRGGVINVGGLKVYPEEVEAVLNADSRVRMSLVRARRNPITGALVVADVVLADAADPRGDGTLAEVVTRDLLNRCRGSLAAHKVPVTLRLVPALELTAAGKLVRPNA